MGTSGQIGMDFGGRMAATRLDGLGPGRLRLSDKFGTLLRGGGGRTYGIYHESMWSYAAMLCRSSRKLLHVIREF